MRNNNTLYSYLLRGRLLVLLLVFTIAGARAQEVEEVEPPAVSYEERQEPPVKEQYDHREFSANRLRELKDQRSFQYDRTDGEKDDEREYRRRENNASNRDRSGESRSSSPGSKPAGGSSNWVIILVVFAAAVVIIMVLLGLKPAIFFKRKTTGIEKAAGEAAAEEDIHHISFETELEKAIRLGNYRLAVRIQYLETLKKLSDRGMIRWLPNKTNRDYVQELASPALQQEFGPITSAFEYAWYGEFAIDEPVFRLMREKVLAFQQKI